METELEVTGGAGGLAADLAAMKQATAVLCGVGGDLAGVTARVSALVVDPHLLRSAQLDPVGFARVQSLLLPLVSGPSGLAASGGRLFDLGTRVALAAHLYERTESAVTALTARARDTAARTAGHAVNSAFTVFLPYTATALASAWVMWCSYRTGPLVFDELVVLGADIGRRDVPLHTLDDRFVRLARRQAFVMRDDVADAGGAALGWLAANPDVAEELVAGTPAFLAGLTNGLTVPGTLVVDSDGLAWPPEDVSEMAALVTALGEISPVFAEGVVDVKRVEGEPTVDLAETTVGVLGAVQRLAGYASPIPPEAVKPRTAHSEWTDGRRHETGRIRIERLERAGRVSWSVYVPPTQSPAIAGGAIPYDMSTNLRSAAGRSTAAGMAVTEALRQAGAAKGQPVMLSGYSQGGLTAAQLASDPSFRQEFDVSTVLTVGSPVGVFDVPGDVQVLSIENEQDLVARLDGARNPDRTHWATVTRDLTQVDGFAKDLKAAPLLPHRIEYYLDTAELVDASTDDSVVAWKAAAAPFLDVSDADVTVSEYSATRTRPATDP
ncbi:MAG TPA: hypothetical protein VFX41_01385 [Actinomycetales bacterium]|nr:hypothetical protein [Actinomycetales bacterium]